MPNKCGRIIAIETRKDGTHVHVLMSDKVPKVGDSVRLRWGKSRSLKANALYWVYLEWVLTEGGLREQAGYVTVQEIHDSLKGHLLMVREQDSHGIMVIREKSTTELDSVAFSEYMEKVDFLINDFFEINTSPFWVEHAKMVGE